MADLMGTVKWSKQFGHFYLVRQSLNYFYLGVHFHRYDGNPCIADPLGAVRGWAAHLALPFFIFSYKSW